MEDGMYIEIFSVIDGERKSIVVKTWEEFEKQSGIKLVVGRSEEE